MKFQSKYIFEEYKGKSINYLIPIRENETLSKDGSKQWDFLCVCGKIVTETPYRVISGHKKSCGCMRYKNITHKQHKTTGIKKFDYDSLLGKKNHRLTVIGCKLPDGKGRKMLECLCDCGNVTYVYPYQFSKGTVKSCGCARFGHSECHKGNTSRRTHNLTKNRFYHVWNDMIRRCYNPKEPAYRWYGACGISVCPEWRDTPVEFIKWCESTYPPNGNFSIDRIDGTKGYSPKNCRWATPLEQSHNTKSNVNITINGETKCVSQWCRDLDISSQVVYKRIKNGLSHKEAILETVKRKRKE